MVKKATPKPIPCVVDANAFFNALLLVHTQSCNGSCFVVWTRGLHSGLFNFQMECECVKIPQQHTFKEDAAAATTPFLVLWVFIIMTLRRLLQRAHTLQVFDLDGAARREVMRCDLHTYGSHRRQLFRHNSRT